MKDNMHKAAMAIVSCIVAVLEAIDTFISNEDGGEE